MGRGRDFLTVSPGLLVSPVAPPMLTINERGMFGSRGKRTDAVGTLVARTATPLALVDLQTALVRRAFVLAHTEARHLFESVVARPTLLTGGVMSK